MTIGMKNLWPKKNYPIKLFLPSSKKKKKSNKGNKYTRTNEKLWVFSKVSQLVS